MTSPVPDDETSAPDTVPGHDTHDDRVADVLAQSDDLSADSDELLANATGWQQRFDLDPARTNILRALDLPPTARILEVGAGGGAITRYLGETAGHVDAVEPAAPRAAAAAKRVVGMENVSIITGTIDDVPATSRYDVVVAIGTLELLHAGDGTDDPAAGFLAKCFELLAEGGSLVLAVANSLGAKSLALGPAARSAPETVGFAGLDSSARTFTRAEVASLLTHAGFESRSLIAFPDFVMTRAVFDAAALAGRPAEELLKTVPVFPSPDWSESRAPAAHERDLWHTLVDAGLAAESGNALLFIASKGSPTHDLWPADRAGRYFSRTRLAEFATQTTISIDGADVSLIKTPLAEPLAEAALFVQASRDDFVEGADLIDELVRSDRPTAERLFATWRDLVTAPDAPQHSLDRLPHNVRVATDGSFVFIDDEWQSASPVVGRVLRRGSLLTGMLLAPLANRIEWIAPGSTARSIAVQLGVWAGLSADGDWITATVDEEAEFQTTVLQHSGQDESDLYSLRRAAILAAIDSASLQNEEAMTQAPVAETAVDEHTARRLELGNAALVRLDAIEKEMADQLAEIEAEHLHHYSELDRHAAMHVAQVRAEHSADYERERSEHSAELERHRVHVEALTRTLGDAEARLRAMESSTSWKVTAGLRRVSGMLSGHSR